MADPRRGFATNTYYKVEAAWGTEVACDRAIPDLLAFPMRTLVEKTDDESLVGSRFRERRILGNVRYQGTLKSYLSYGEIDPLIAAVVAEKAVVQAAGPPQVTRYEPDILASPRSFTLAHRLLEATTNVRRVFVGCRVHRATIAWETGKPLTVELEIVAKSRTDASSVNTDAALDAATKLSSPHVVHTPGVALARLGDRADALGAGDNVNVVSGSLVINDHFAIEDLGAEDLASPVPDGFLEATLSLTLARLDVETYRTWVDANTELQALLEWQESANRIYRLQVGAMTLSDDFGEVIEGPDLIRPTLNFSLHRAETNNPTFTSWTNRKRPFAIEVTSSDMTANPLP